jgi:hypothetical protein
MSSMPLGTGLFAELLQLGLMEDRFLRADRLVQGFPEVTIGGSETGSFRMSASLSRR